MFTRPSRFSWVGRFINYFNRFGRTWQVYLQADGPFRTKPEDVGQFYVRNNDGQSSSPISLDADRAAFWAGIHDALQFAPMRSDQRQW